MLNFTNFFYFSGEKGELKEVEDAGIGEGEGKKDVSEQIEDESQVGKYLIKLLVSSASYVMEQQPAPSVKCLFPLH